MLARFAAHFAKLWSAVATEPPLWEGGGRRVSRERRKHQTLRGVTIPPPSQSGGLATALQGASHENVRRYNLGATQQRYPFGAAGFATLAVVIADSSVSISSFCEPREIVMCLGGYDGGSYVTTTSPTVARDKPAAAYEYAGPSGGR